MVDPNLLQGAMRLQSAGRYEEAISLYHRVLSDDPKNLSALVYGGIAFAEIGKLSDATKQLKFAVQLQPNHAEAHGYLANVLQLAGDLQTADTHYRMAVFLDPKDPLIQSNFGLFLSKKDRRDEAITCFRQAISMAPDYAPAYSHLCNCLRQSGNVNEAVKIGRRALELDPHSSEACNNLAAALIELDCIEEAIQCYQQAITLQPTFIDALNNLSIAQIIAGRAVDALVSIDKCLQVEPGNIQALATKSVALNEVGDKEGLSALVDYDLLTRERFIDTPLGYANIEAFNETLSQHLREHPSLRYAPSGNATREGMHSGDLLATPNKPFQDLKSVLQQTVTDYINTCPKNAVHPFMASQPEVYELDIWGLVLTEKGHQVPHIHSTGWLSGCYYPKVPPDIHQSDTERKGWFVFGEPQQLYRANANAQIMPICPEEGKLILFPSFFFHHTNPVSVANERISIAFDVRPVDKIG